MALERIKINDVIFECFTVSYTDDFHAIIKTEDLEAVETLFNEAEEIIIMNNIGQIIKTFTGWDGIKSIGKTPDYYFDDEENVSKAVINITLKQVDVANKLKTLESKLDTTVNEAAMTLDEYKEYKIAQSKVALEEYLDANPITSTAHAEKEGIYSITKEKQDLMSQQYLTYQIMKTVNPDNAVLTWNERGGICEPWTEEEFVQLVMEIKARVYPLVSYQQYLEKQIHDSYDKAEIAALEFDYDNAIAVVNE